MRIKCRAIFSANAEHQFGFYGLPDEPGQCIYNNDEFQYEFTDKDEIVERDGEQFVKAYPWMKVLEAPKKKPGPKPKESVNDDQQLQHA